MCLQVRSPPMIKSQWAWPDSAGSIPRQETLNPDKVIGIQRLHVSIRRRRYAIENGALILAGVFLRTTTGNTLTSLHLRYPLRSVVRFLLVNYHLLLANSWVADCIKGTKGSENGEQTKGSCDCLFPNGCHRCCGTQFFTDVKFGVVGEAIETQCVNHQHTTCMILIILPNNQQSGTILAWVREKLAAATAALLISPVVTCGLRINRFNWESI